MKNYNVERFGEPTWQQLVEAVGHPAGGANMTLARNIVKRHKAASGANIAVAGGTTRKRKGTNIAVPGETTTKHKAVSGANVPRKMARSYKPEGMSIGAALFSL